MNTVTVHTLITQARQERGLSHTELAAAVGVSGPYLSDLLHGKRGQRVWPQYAVKLARVLGKPANSWVKRNGSD